MPRPIDPDMAEILKGFGYGPEACWDCHGVWVIYHKFLEKIAAQAGIIFEPPTVIEARSDLKTAVVCVTGHMGTKVEWSFGEATPANNKNSYPYAMAEKRAKDRVIIKLAGLHGLYSEEEAEDFKDSRPRPEPEPEGDPVPSKDAIGWATEILRCENISDVNRLKNTVEFKNAWKHLNKVDRAYIANAADQLLAQIEAAESPPPDLLYAGE